MLDGVKGIKNRRPRSSLLLVGHTNFRSGRLDTDVVAAKPLFAHRLVEKPFRDFPGFRKSVDVHPIRLHHDAVTGMLHLEKACIPMRDTVEHLTALVVEDECGVTPMNGCTRFTDIHHEKPELSGSHHSL